MVWSRPRRQMNRRRSLRTVKIRVNKHLRPAFGHDGLPAITTARLRAYIFILRDGVAYHDLGGRYFVERDKQQLTKTSCDACATWGSSSK